MHRWDSKRRPKYLVDIQKANGETLPEDEPVFILRGRDPFAAPLVRMYAQLKGSITTERDVNDLMELAREMEEFEHHRLPDPDEASPEASRSVGA